MVKIIRDSMKDYVATATIIVYVIILVMCCYMFYGSVSYRASLPQTNNYKVSLTVVDKDTLLDERSRKELDSLKVLLSKLPKEEYADGINDVRQETNNIINKINGWLSFWLAIIALIGGVLPVLISWKKEKDYTAQFDNLKKDHETRFERQKQYQDRSMEISRANVDLSISELKSTKDEIEKKNDKYRKDFQDLQTSLRIHETQINITNIVGSFIAAKDNNLFQGSLDRDLLRSSLLKDLSCEFEAVINQIFPNHYYSNDNKMVMKTILIQFHALFTCLRPTLVKFYKTKQLEDILNVLKETIDTVTEDRLSACEIEEKIKEVRNEIYKSNALFYDNM